MQIISDATGLTGYRFPLCLAQSPVMGVKMAEIALVACACSLQRCDGELGELLGAVVLTGFSAYNFFRIIDLNVLVDIKVRYCESNIEFDWAWSNSTLCKIFNVTH